MPQPHKGNRVYTPARLDSRLSQLVRDDARRNGVPVGDMVAVILADHYGRDDLAPAARQREALPLS